MFTEKCEICGTRWMLRPIQFHEGLVCRTCLLWSGVSEETLGVSYKTTSISLVRDGLEKRKLEELNTKKEQHERQQRDRLESARFWAEEAKKKEMKALERERKIKERERQAEENRIREEEEKRIANDTGHIGYKKEVVFKSKWFSRDDAIMFFPNQGRLVIRENEEEKEYKTADILEFEVLEDGFSIAKGGLGRAVVGGLLLGGVGAVVGAVTGGKKSKDVVTSLRLQLTLRDPANPVRYIDFLPVESKRDGTFYRLGITRLAEVVALFKIMSKPVPTTSPKPPRKNTSAKSKRKVLAEESAKSGRESLADELIKFKDLLDQGLITRAEFNRQKKRILG